MTTRLKIDGTTGTAAIYDTSAGDAPFTTPLSHIDKLFFHSDLRSIGVQTVVTGSITLPARAANGSFNAVQNLYTHGLGGIPYVEGRITAIGGSPVSIPLCGSVPVDQQSGVNASSFARFVHLGANATHVVLSEYTETHFATAFGSLSISYEIYVTDVLL